MKEMKNLKYEKSDTKEKINTVRNLINKMEHAISASLIVGLSDIKNNLTNHQHDFTSYLFFYFL